MFVMIGLPGESVADFRKPIRWSELVNHTIFGWQSIILILGLIFTILPGIKSYFHQKSLAMP